jgi:hypothetical protein
VTELHASDIGPTFVPARGTRAYTVEIDGEAIVLDEEQNRLHLLNATATILWACFDGQSTLAAIADDVAETVALDAAQITDEVVALARTLGAEGLLDGVVPDPGAHGVAVADVEAS